MQIRSLTAYVIRLPLKRAFRHASAARNESENVLVRCELADGTTGWGEGVPRSYVTGETPIGAVEQLAATPLAQQLTTDAADWPSVLQLCAAFAPPPGRDDPRGCYGNALRCAVELAILDVFGRLFGEPVASVALHVRELPPVRDFSQVGAKLDVPYSAVIDSGNRALWRKALVRRLYGFRDCKVKVGAAGDDDAARLRTIRRWIGPSTDLRLDANEAWSAAELRAKLGLLTEFRISCIEQPVPHAEVSALAELRKELGVKVMLDESLTSMADAQAAIASETCDLFNVRLSKCGGFVASLRLAAVAHEAGIGYQLGCHPGETGVLSAAGRHWAAAVAGIHYLEGSYDRYLFRDLPTNEDVTFQYGGRAPVLAGPGLGVTMNPRVLEEVTVSKRVFAM